MNQQITCKVMIKHSPVISPSSPCLPLSIRVPGITLSTVLSCPSPPFAVSFISHISASGKVIPKAIFAVHCVNIYEFVFLCLPSQPLGISLVFFQKCHNAISRPPLAPILLDRDMFLKGRTYPALSPPSSLFSQSLLPSFKLKSTWRFSRGNFDA